MVHFLTRITRTSFTSIDNIFTDNSSNYFIKQYTNGLSDHDAQVLHFNVICQPMRPTKYTYIRNLNKHNIVDFQLCLSYEQWQDVFGVNDVNCMFNNFLNTYLRCYHSSFLIIKKYNPNQIQKEWITNGIKVPWKRKKELFILCKITNNHRLKLYHKNTAQYCLK